MGEDLGPYELIDERYEAFEQQTVLLRLLQCAPAERRVSQEELECVMRWVVEYQQQRASMAALLKGVAGVTLDDGRPVVRAHPGTPLPSVESLARRGELPREWLEARLPDPEP